MHYQIQPNSKHESFQRTALLEQIMSHDPACVTIVVTRADLVDPEQEPILENFSIPKHHLAKVDRVIFDDRDAECCRSKNLLERVLYTKSK